MPTPEELARIKIDEKLNACGSVIQDMSGLKRWILDMNSCGVHDLITQWDLQEEFAPFAPLRGSSTRVVRRAVVEPSRVIESLRGRMGESTRQVEGLFESLLAEAFA